MNLILPGQQKVDTVSPVMTFYEDGEWLRIETQGKPTRYIRQNIAKEILRSYGVESVSEKSDIIII